VIIKPAEPWNWTYVQPLQWLWQSFNDLPIPTKLFSSSQCYKPLRALASAPEGEIRRIDVASRRIGLKLISRRQFAGPNNAQAT